MVHLTPPSPKFSGPGSKPRLLGGISGLGRDVRFYQRATRFFKLYLVNSQFFSSPVRLLSYDTIETVNPQLIRGQMLSVTLSRNSSLEIWSKFNVPDDPLSLVLDIDGCLIETNDLPSVISSQQPLMMLCRTEAKSKVGTYNLASYIIFYIFLFT